MLVLLVCLAFGHLDKARVMMQFVARFGLDISGVKSALASVVVAAVVDVS
jgi:hypothetical protein